MAVEIGLNRTETRVPCIAETAEIARRWKTTDAPGDDSAGDERVQWRRRLGKELEPSEMHCVQRRDRDGDLLDELSTPYIPIDRETTVERGD